MTAQADPDNRADDDDSRSHDGDSGLAPGTIALLVCGMSIFGSGTPVSSIVGRELAALTASGLRMLLAGAALTPVLIWWERRHDRRFGDRLRALETRERWALFGVAVIGTFGFSVFMVLGMREVPGSVGATIMATTPAITALASVVFFGERFDRRLLMALGFGVVGVGIVQLASADPGEGGDAVLLGSLLVLAAVCSESLYTLLGGRYLSGKLDMVELSTVAALGAVVCFAVPAAWQGRTVDWGGLELASWLAVLWWGLGTMGLGSVIWFAGVKRVSGGTASVFMAAMPVSALVLSYLLLDETFRWLHVVGMACVLAGIAVVARRQEE